MLLGTEYVRAVASADPAPTEAWFFAPGESAVAWSSRVRLQVLPSLAPGDSPLDHARRIADEVGARHGNVRADLDPQADSDTVLLDYFFALPERGADGKRYLQFNAWRFTPAAQGQSVIGVHYAAKLEGPGRRSLAVGRATGYHAATPGGVAGADETAGLSALRQTALTRSARVSPKSTSPLASIT
ncbi:MAG: hypothetical protein R3E68_06035 [Burkholderiaceae bacterium]